MKKVEFIQMSQLVDMQNIYAVVEEVKNNFIRYYQVESFPVIRSLFKKLNKFCSGNSQDFSQTAGIMLAFSRIVDGYNIENTRPLEEETVILGLAASLLCKPGLYSYFEETPCGTDKKHNMALREAVQKVFDKFEVSEEQFKAVKEMVSCADVNFKLSEAVFRSESEKTVALMVASADILGRMSSRNYLEKLTDYYDSVKEGLDEYARLTLLKQNIQHYRSVIMERLENELSGFYKLCENHFDKRYDIGYNMYIEAIDRQIEHLEDILQEGSDSYRKHLKRRAE